MSDVLPYGRQSIDEQDIAAVVEVLRSDYLTTGPAVEGFEAAMCKYTGAKHAVAVNSGTAALHAAYFAAGLRPGDEIITSPLTFVATANAARFLGANVQFVDIDPRTGNLDPELIEAAINPRTKLIVPVDFAGHPADYDRICEIARRHNLLVVADAAHSLGATYRGRNVGTLADITATSFHPVKPITTAEGGMLLTDRADFAERAILFRSHGITRNPRKMDRAEPWWYEMHCLGYNYRLSDLHCALGRSQLAKLDAFITRRREIAAVYTHAFSSESSFRLPHLMSDVESAWHLYVIRLHDGPDQRRAFYDHLNSCRIAVQIHYIPVHRQPFYRNLNTKTEHFPNADEFYSQCLSLPIFPKMSDADTLRVVNACDEARKAVAHRDDRHVDKSGDLI